MGNSSLSCLPPSPLAFDQLGPSATAMDVIECARNVPNLLDEISNKVAIVTGGSSGIGLETVKALALTGCKVYMACRSKDSGKDAIEKEIMQYGKGGYMVEDVSKIVVAELDLSDLKSIKTFCTKFCQSETRLDYLVLNAGVMALPERQETSSGFEMHIGVNYLGHVYMTSLLHPLLSSVDYVSRLIILSSLAHQYGEIDLKDMHFKSRPYDPWKAFSQSQLANCLFADKVAEELNNSKSIALIVNPGVVNYSLWIESGYISMLNLFSHKNIPEAAATIVWACLSPDLTEKEDFSGAYLEECKFVKFLDEKQKSLRDELWKRTADELEEALNKLGISD